MLKFFPDNDKHDNESHFHSYSYYHGDLEVLAENLGAYPPDMVRCNIKQSELTEGIHDAEFSDGTKCKAYFWLRDDRISGYIVRTDDAKANAQALEAYNRKAQVI